MSTSFTIPVEAGSIDSVSAILDEPEGEAREVAFLFAHGAGAPFDSEFMVRIAQDLVGRGFAVARFQYPYMERARRDDRRRPPDRRPVLEAAHRAALAALRSRLPDRRVVLMGKSLGGRIGSYLAAEGADCAGLVFLGYPLHPPGKPDRPRIDHFPDLRLPTLFLQGTRDKLCDLDLLEDALKSFGGDAELVRIEGGDHGFKVPKKYGGEGCPPYAELAEQTERWVTGLG